MGSGDTGRGIGRGPLRLGMSASLLLGDESGEGRQPPPASFGVHEGEEAQMLEAGEARRRIFRVASDGAIRYHGLVLLSMPGGVTRCRETENLLTRSWELTALTVSVVWVDHTLSRARLLRWTCTHLEVVHHRLLDHFGDRLTRHLALRLKARPHVRTEPHAATLFRRRRLWDLSRV